MNSYRMIMIHPSRDDKSSFCTQLYCINILVVEYIYDFNFSQIKRKDCAQTERGINSLTVMLYFHLFVYFIYVLLTCLQLVLPTHSDKRILLRGVEIKFYFLYKIHNRWCWYALLWYKYTSILIRLVHQLFDHCVVSHGVVYMRYYTVISY